MKSLRGLFYLTLIIVTFAVCGRGLPEDRSRPAPTIAQMAEESSADESTSTSASEPDATPEPSQPTNTLTTHEPLVTAGENNVNIRSGPGTDYEVVGSLPAGQSLEIIGRNADSTWWQVSTPNGTGWLAASVTTVSNVDENIPLAEVPPLPTPELVAPASGNLQEAQVINVVDGDTIDVLIGGIEYRVRYILIDTPETYGGIEPFGPEASEANRQLVEGQNVRLEKDVSETDQYGRLLRYVYVGDLMVNEELLRRGLAQVATFPPDVKYIDRFLAIQREAQAVGVGIWGSQPVVEQPSAVPTQAPSTSGYSGPYDPFGPDRDCGDFSTWSEAQAFYEAAGGPGSDRHDLDRDRDGIACESLR